MKLIELAARCISKISQEHGSYPSDPTAAIRKITWCLWIKRCQREDRRNIVAKRAVWIAATRQ